MAYVQLWDEEPSTSRTRVTIALDGFRDFHEVWRLRQVTNIASAELVGNTLTLTFFYEDTKDIALREVMLLLKDAGKVDWFSEGSVIV